MVLLYFGFKDSNFWISTVFTQFSVGYMVYFLMGRHAVITNLRRGDGGFANWYSYFGFKILYVLCANLLDLAVSYTPSFLRWGARVFVSLLPFRRFFWAPVD